MLIIDIYSRICTLANFYQIYRYHTTQRLTCTGGDGSPTAVLVDGSCDWVTWVGVKRLPSGWPADGGVDGRLSLHICLAWGSSVSVVGLFPPHAVTLCSADPFSLCLPWEFQPSWRECRCCSVFSHNCSTAQLLDHLSLPALPMAHTILPWALL